MYEDHRHAGSLLKTIRKVNAKKLQESDILVGHRFHTAGAESYFFDNSKRSRRTVLLKGSDIKRTSRRTALLKGRNTRTIRLPLRHLKGIGIGMTPLSDWLNVLLRGSGIAGVT